MKFAFTILHDQTLPEAVKWWRYCDEAGVSVLGIGDSPALLREVYVSATLCAENTTRCTVMPAVTNPITRDPSVTAAAIFSLDEIAPGRIGLGIGSGDSALWGVGLKPAKVETIREYILAVKGLLRGETIEYQGRTFKSQWANRGDLGKVPVYVACAGPKILRMAAQVADGMLVQMGFGDDNIAYVQKNIAEACAEVGRDPSTLDLWWTTTVHFGPSIEEAMESNLGVNTSWMTMGNLQGKQIPAGYREPLVELTRVMHDLTTEYRTPNLGKMLVQRAKELGIYDWLITRAPGFWGPPEVVLDRLRQFEARGMTNWRFYLGRPGNGRYEDIQTICTEIIPKVL